MDDVSSGQYDAMAHLLSHVGLLALDAGLEEEAESIFRYQRRVLADPAALEVSRAIVLLCRGRVDQSVEILRDVLANDPTHAAANAILGLALQAAGEPGARECFETVLAVSVDSESREVASAGLAWQQ
jgi:predicted Zn-dependent protease